MKKQNKNRILGVILGLAMIAGPAAASEQWLHVRVIDDEPHGEKINVNLPLSMIEAFLPMIESEGLSYSEIDWHAGEIHGINLHEFLEALQDAPDTNFVTLRSDHEDVRVAKENGFIVVHVDDDDEHVRVRLPIGVVEAALGEDGDLDLVAALRRMADFDGGDLITVESDRESIRVWIDHDQSGD
jgi:hypothetical protein